MRRSSFFFLFGLFLVSSQGAPSFTNLPTTVSIDETLAQGQNVFEIESTSDTTGANTYTVVCVDASSSPNGACNMFGVTPIDVANNKWRGYITVAQQLDAINTPTYLLSFRATDSSGQSSTAVLRVDVRAVRIRPPRFTSKLDEEISQRPTASQEEIIRYVAEDPTQSNRVVNYRILDGPFKDYFALDQVLGRLTNTRPLQYSDPVISNSLPRLRIQAAYVFNGSPAWDNPSASTTINSTIFLKDQNLNRPVFDSTSYAGSIQENAPPDTFVNNIIFVVQDQDRSLSSASFDVSLSDHNNIFKVVPDSGYGRLEARLAIRTNEFFNYNKGPRYYLFNVIARETSSNERFTSTVPVNVTIIQVNRFTPQFKENPYRVSIPENAVPGSSVVKVEAWDEDVGDFGNRSIWYRFSTGASDTFKMDTQTGLITVANCRKPGVSPCLDYENTQLRNTRLIVWGADLRGEGKTGTTTVVVNLQNVNDNAPRFEAETYFGSINDHTSNLSSLVPSQLATDADNDMITYSLVGSPLWRINPSTGQISPTRNITYSDAPNGLFDLGITARDTQFEAKARVRIQVNPINRFSPRFERAVYNETIPETRDSVRRVVATDLDNPDTKEGQILYTIVSGGQGKFEIDRTSGQVSVIPGQKLDYQTQSFYNMTIEARDQGQPPRSDRCILLVYLTPDRPFIELVDSTQYVSDDKNVDTLVTRLQPKTSQLTNPDLQYRVLGQRIYNRNLVQLPGPDGDLKDLFRVSSDNGEVFVNKRLDANVVRKWEGDVEVSAGTLKDTGLLTIWISATNKVKPRFELPWTPEKPSYDMYVQQGDNFQRLAGSYRATPGNSSLSITYELTDPNNRFRLESPNSGDIIQESPINQATNNYVLKLRATDNGQPPQFSEADINVFTILSNLVTPQFDKSQYDVRMKDDVVKGYEVVQVRATDPEKGNFGDVRYKFELPAPRFRIDEEDGKITVDRSNFDAPSEPFIFLYVRAFDSPADPSKSRASFSLVNITVEDGNNNAPTFNAATYQKVIYSNAEVGSNVLTVSATDADQGENARIIYAIVQGNEEGYFGINENSGLITVAKTLKEEKTSYRMVVEAADNGIPRLKTQSNVTIFVNVLCSTDCLPLWLEPSAYLFTKNVPETEELKKEIVRLRATPYDKTSPLSYFFDVDGGESNSSGPFSIISTNNNFSIVLNSPLNYNLQREYELVTTVKDGTGAKASRFIVINVQPIRQFNPRFEFDEQKCTVPVELHLLEGVSRGSLIGRVVAKANHVTDVVRYKLKATENNDYFEINNNGEIYTKTELNVTQYTFNVKAEYVPNDFKQEDELCRGSDQSEVRVDVRVEPYSIFIPEQITICVKRDTLPNTEVAHLNTFLSRPLSNITSITYTKTDNNTAYDITSDGRVILLDLNEAMRYVCVRQEECSRIRVDVQQMHNDYPIYSSVYLETYEVPEDQPLTLITLNSELNEYNKGKARPDLMRSLARNTNYQCVVDVGFHTTASGGIESRLTDVFLYTMNSEREGIAPMQLDGLYRSVKDRKDAGIIGITDASSRIEGINWEPVAIAMGLIIALLFLACLFFLCFCCWGYCSQWCYKKLNEKEPIISDNGLAEKIWTSQPVLDLHPEPPIPDVDILPAESYHSNRREDVATVDGAASSVLPTGYVHIEAPLERSASSFGGVDEVDTRVETRVDTIQRGVEVQEHVSRNKEYERDEVKARAYSSKSGGLDDIDAGEDQKPVQLNLSENNGPSQIGAVLIRPETPRGQGYTQRIVGGDGTYDSSTYHLRDPSTLHMSYQNEMALEDMPGQTVYYDETQGPDGTYQNQPITYESVVQRFEETKYL